MKITIVCTQGGHLTETLQLLEAFSGHEILFVTHHSSRDRDIAALAPAHFSRSIDGKIGRLLASFPWALRILLRERPDVIFSMGAEIAIPFVFWAKWLGIRTIYIESWCRVKTLSLTGRLFQPFVDEFWVQWEDLLARCGRRARYHGAVL